MFKRHRLYNINRGAHLGLAMGAVAAFLMLTKNSEFIDDISDYILLFLIPPTLIGAVIGLILPFKLPDKGRPYGLGKFKTRPCFIGIVILIICALPPVISMVKEGADSDKSWSPKLIIIGMDGATWNVIRPMVSSGKLPNLAALIKKGASGDLRSEQPMISPALWNTIATGMPREVHGVYTFFDTSYDCKSPRFWEIMSEKKGLKFGIYRWMGTWPPSSDGLFLLPDWTARDFTTHPKELSYIQRFYGEGIQGTDLTPSGEMALAYRLVPRGMKLSEMADLGLFNLKRFLGSVPSDKERFYYNTMFRGGMDGVIARNLFEKYKPQVAVFASFTPDEIGHLFWDSAPGKNGGERIQNAYSKMDETIGALLDGLPSSTMVMVVSDHGFTGLNAKAYFDVPIVDKVLEKAGAGDKVEGIIVGNHLYIYASSNAKPDQEGEIIGEMLNRFKAFEMNGRPLVRAHIVRGGLEISVQADRKNRPGSEALCNVGENSFSCSEILKPFDVSASHDLEGVIIFSGPGVKRGTKLDAASIYDITPTLLNYFGLPVGENMPGKVLHDGFVPEWNAKHPVRHITAYPFRKLPDRAGDDATSKARLEERLRALGYIQ